MSRRSFNQLARRIAAQYRRRGYSARRASYIGRATAAKIARLKRAAARRRRRSRRGPRT